MAYIKINKNNFFHNLTYFTNLVGNKSKLSIALKDNAYGHGLEEIASLCKEYGIKHVFVKNINEAKRIKQFKFDSIQILYEIPKNKTKYNISINSLEDLELIPINSKIELKIDTGMHRNGLVLDEIVNAINIIKKKNLRLKGVFSHFCCADEKNIILEKQEEKFFNIIEKIKKIYKKEFEIHIANSAGVHRIDTNVYDRFRIGIGSYGYLELPEYVHNVKPVLSLYAKRISTRILDKGDSVGYGSKSVVIKNNNTIVSNYDIGYGDGFLRLNENQTYNIKNGKQILGRISMDSFSIEGKDGNICIFDDVSKLAKIHNTISYEVLTQLSPFLKRVII